jgi:tetratricopeptide (TPR) repeat protein
LTGKNYGISNASYSGSLFSATLIQSNGLEGLGNAALQRGIDRLTKKDFEGTVKEFKRSVGIGRGPSFAADTTQYLAMTYIQLEDTENAIKAYKSAFTIDP